MLLKQNSCFISFIRGRICISLNKAFSFKYQYVYTITNPLTRTIGPYVVFIAPRVKNLLAKLRHEMPAPSIEYFHTPQ